MLRRVLVAAVLAACALGFLPPAARADGDPGSDVLVYQNLFVAADANVSVQQQLQLGNLLTAADKDGFPVRVAVISQPDDLGAITALWQKPAAYASFLGTELSLAYAQRLLIVMPNGFGFNWPGHSATAAYQVLDGLRIGAGGAGLATAAQNAVLALAHASGVRLTIPASRRPCQPEGRASGQAHGTQPVAQPAATPRWPAHRRAARCRSSRASRSRSCSRRPAGGWLFLRRSGAGDAGCRGRGCRASRSPLPGSRAGSWARGRGDRRVRGGAAGSAAGSSAARAARRRPAR